MELTIRFDATDPPCGEVRTTAGAAPEAAWTFSGFLGLLKLLEELLASPAVGS